MPLAKPNEGNPSSGVKVACAPPIVLKEVWGLGESAELRRDIEDCESVDTAINLTP